MVARLPDATAVTVSGDQQALGTMLRNLVDNAVRYTERGGRVDVSVAAASTGMGPTLVVTDDGPGIPAEERGRVFDRFYRRAGAALPGGAVPARR